MCPLYPVHLILSYGGILALVWFVMWPAKVWSEEVALKVRLNESLLTNLLQGDTHTLTFFIDDLPHDAMGEILIKEESADGISHVAFDPPKVSLPKKEEEKAVNVTGSFLGFSKVRFVLSSGLDDNELMQSHPIPIKVHRETQPLDIAFVHVIVLLVIVAFINMGCAIDCDVIKENVRRPVAPAIGLASQYIFMPLVSYGLGFLLFRETPELWLGLFLTGCAPGGGGSNLWTYLLGGSLDLSIAMTFLSTLLAFAALPLWVFALGPSIFPEGSFGHLPYRNIATLLVGLVVPLGVGLVIRRWCPRGADVLKRLLKPVAVIFILFILTFGIYAKFYLFSFFSWKVALGGFLVPTLGFLFGGFVARLARRKPEDVIAIAVETGVQNTGLAIGVLKVALLAFDPLGDISIVVPVAVATFTPLPLFVVYLWKRLKQPQVPPNNSSIHLNGNHELKEGYF